MDMDDEGGKNKKPKSKMKATKDYKLLSFGEQAEEEEDDLKEVQVKYCNVKHSMYNTQFTTLNAQHFNVKHFNVKPLPLSKDSMALCKIPKLQLEYIYNGLYSQHD